MANIDVLSRAAAAQKAERKAAVAAAAAAEIAAAQVALDKARREAEPKALAALAERFGAPGFDLPITIVELQFVDAEQFSGIADIAGAEVAFAFVGEEFTTAIWMLGDYKRTSVADANELFHRVERNERSRSMGFTPWDSLDDVLAAISTPIVGTDYVAVQHQRYERDTVVTRWLITMLVACDETPGPLFTAEKAIGAAFAADKAIAVLDVLSGPIVMEVAMKAARRLGHVPTAITELDAASRRSGGVRALVYASHM